MREDKLNLVAGEKSTRTGKDAMPKMKTRLVSGSELVAVDVGVVLAEACVAEGIKDFRIATAWQASRVVADSVRCHS